MTTSEAFGDAYLTEGGSSDPVPAFARTQRS